jgi:hypothetical protein
VENRWFFKNQNLLFDTYVTLYYYYYLEGPWPTGHEKEKKSIEVFFVKNIFVKKCSIKFLKFNSIQFESSWNQFACNVI